jgi:hypothetical protein
MGDEARAPGSRMIALEPVRAGDMGLYFDHRRGYDRRQTLLRADLRFRTRADSPTTRDTRQAFP